MPAPTTGQVILDSIPLLTAPGSYVRTRSPLYGQAPLRTGAPADLGPYSTWQQSSYIGGIGADKSIDPEMYFFGTADTRFGWAQCRFALQKTSGSAGDNLEKILVVRPVSLSGTVYMYTATRGGLRLWKRSALTAADTNQWTAPANITAVGRSFHGGQFALHIGLTDGRLYTIGSGVDAAPSQDTTYDTGTDPISFLDSLGSKGDIAATSNALYKHVDGKWSRALNVDLQITDGEPWNQRFWFVGTDNRFASKLYVTDLLTTQDIHSWPTGFIAKGITLHYGTLYILGHTHAEEFGKKIGQIWSYNGASVRLIYEVPDEVWSAGGFSDYQFYKAYSYRKWLLWGYPHKGLYAYDPEQDAVHPAITLEDVVDDVGNYVTSITTLGGRLAAVNYNETSANVEIAAREHKQSFVISSEYDGGLPNTSKLWTHVRVRMVEPLPTGTSVKVYLAKTPVTHEVYPTTAPWTLLGTISAGTQEQTLRITGGSFTDYRSTTLRYALELNPATYTGAGTNATPKVASVQVDYLIIDTPKLGWSFTAIAADDMLAPDGDDFEDTAAETETALLALFSNPAKQVVSFTDKDGTAYDVKVLNLTQFVRNVDPGNPDGETSEFAISLGEV